MGRLERIHYPGAIHHIWDRGVDRQPVFRDDEDRRAFLADLILAKAAHGLKVLAYCLMGNHFHLLVEALLNPVGDAVHQLLTRYSKRFNLKYERTGHLFESRFGSRLCESEPYLLELLAYIHLNPVRDGFAKAVDEWPWSSHRAIMGQANDPILDLDRLLERLEMSPPDLRDAYSERLRLSSERDEASAPDRPSLKSLLQDCAERHGLPVPRILAGCRERAFTAARAEFLAMAEARGYRAKEIAYELRCSPAALTYLRRRLI